VLGCQSVPGRACPGIWRRRRIPINGTALRIAGVYALASVAWILLSDRVAGWLARDPAALARLQQWKGLVFVLATAALIWWLVHRSLASAQRASAALVAQERHFRELYEQAPTGYQSLDEQGRLLAVNQAWLDLMGYDDRAEVLGRPITDFLEPSQGLLMQERFPAFKASGRLQDAEFVLRRRDGGLVTVTVDGRIQRHGDGSFRQTHCVLHDITERQRSLEALRESERRLALALDGARLGTFEWDIRSGDVRWSERHAELYGIGLDQFDGTREEAFGCIHPDDRPRVEQAVDAARQHGEWLALEYRVVWPDGSVHWIEAAGRYRFDDQGEAVNLLGVTMDIDGRKRAEAEQRELEEQLRQAQKMEAVGQLAGGVAHDFNNLLQVINGYSDMVLSDLSEDHPVRPYVSEVSRAGNRAARLVSQLLAFSRRQVLEPEDLDLNEVIGGLLDMAARTLGERVDLDWRPGESVGAIHADRGQIEQVIMNLWINARDAMPEGGVLTVATDNLDADEAFCRRHPWARRGRHVRLTVTDTGEGMDARTVDRIWEPFFTTKEPGKGTGLGLSTVYGIVRQHDGVIHLESEPGRGTSFEIHLPRVDRVPRPPGDRRAPSSVGGHERILVAEDSERVRELVCTILGRAGYDVVAVSDGHEAQAYLEEHGDTVDLALVDVVMPGQGGRELHAQVRERLPDLRFLFTSGYGLDAMARGPVPDDGIDLIQKPFEATALLTRVRQLLERR
jgi:PAS domain S-box-containing protein